MTTWIAVVGAGLVAYALELAGHLVPARWVQHPVAVRVSASLPVALFAALVVVQTFASGDRVVVDARVVGLAVAAALTRAAGWG